VPFNLKTPIGLLFSVYGILLLGRGLLGEPSGWVRSLGLNINLVWGGVLLTFGLGLLLVTYLLRRRHD
jgi:hypothetical protein